MTAASANRIKKRATAQSAKPHPLAMLSMTGPGRDACKIQTHDEMMQRFQPRRVSSDKIIPAQFGRGKHLIIDKTTGSKHRKSQRFSLRRVLRSTMGANARAQLIARLTSPITPKSWMSTLHGLVMLGIYHFQLLYLLFAPSYLLDDYHRYAGTFAVLETVFLVDLLLNFNTGYFDQGGLVMARSKIASNYVRSWFFFDLLSALPLQVGYNFASRSNLSHPVLHGTQLTLMGLRLVRTTFLKRGVLLRRVMRVANHVAEWVRYSRYSHLLRIAQLMWFVLLIAHYMACVWHVVSTSGSSQAAKDRTVGEKYVADYYYAVSLIQGQGNSVGAWEENFYSSVAIIVGSGILAIVYGSVALLVSNFNANETNYHRKMEAVYAMMAKMDLPLELRKRVNEYYTHVWLEYEVLDGSINKFEKELTHTLRIEIGLYKFMNLVGTVPFWEGCSPDFLTQIVLSLSMRVYMPDDYVVRRREIGTEMMMINQGYCKLSKPVKGLVAGTPASPSVDSAAASVLTQEGMGTHSEVDEDSDDEWSDTSDDESDDDLEGQVLSSQGKARRLSGSAFELKGAEDTKPEALNQRRLSNPRRHSNPSSVEFEMPTRYRVYLNPGQAFGEMSLLMKYERHASIRAVTFVEMCVLDRAAFQKIISRYPQDRRRVLTKMLESCIVKKEVPFPWENIVEAAMAKRRSSRSKDATRATVIATMTAAEAARILVEAIDVNVPDDSIKYGFQSFDQQFVDEPSLRRANSVEAKIRDTLQRASSGLSDSVYSGMRDIFQRTNSGIASYRVYSRRSSRVDTNRSTSTADLTEPDSDTQEGAAPSTGTTEKTLETMMQLMQTMVANIGRLQEDVDELKAREFCCKRCGDVAQQSLPEPVVPSTAATAVVKPVGEPEARAISQVNSCSPTLRPVEDEALDIKERARDKMESKTPPNVLENLPPANAAPKAGKAAQDADRGGPLSLACVKSGGKGPRVDRSAWTSTDGSLPQPELARYADGNSPKCSSRTKTERHPSFSDLLWKRRNTSGGLLKQPPSLSKGRRQLKTRQSLPAGASVAVAFSTPRKMAPIPDEHDV
jgi:CRP-like cAMP-binding protein